MREISEAPQSVTPRLEHIPGAGQDDAGQFSALQLDIGTYEVRVERGGFRTILLTTAVRSGEVSRLNFALEVGSVSEVVSVEGSAETILDTANAQVSDSWRGAQVSELPLLTHNPVSIATLAPGTVPVTKDNPFLGVGSVNANGQRGRANNITIDNSTASELRGAGADYHQGWNKPISRQRL